MDESRTESAPNGGRMCERLGVSYLCSNSRRVWKKSYEIIPSYHTPYPTDCCVFIYEDNYGASAFVNLNYQDNCLKSYIS